MTTNSRGHAASDACSVGICLGASRITAVKVRKSGDAVVSRESFGAYHGGSVKQTLRSILEDNGLTAHRIAVTGRKFRALVALPEISEPEAVELAYDFLKDRYPPVQAIVSAGGETFMVYRLDDTGRITAVYTGGKCASGTGEFFLQQVRRIGMEVDDVPDLADVEDPYRLSGRCSVFCKSDCTHALNKGENKARVLAGLCKMMADKIIELLGKAEATEIMLIGGTANNANMVRFLRQRLQRVVVPDEADCFETLGAALWALDADAPAPDGDLFRANASSFQTLPPLSDSLERVTFHTSEDATPQSGDRCILGIDVGSTTTKAMLVRESDTACLARVYLRTDGDPVKAAQNCYRSLAEQLAGVDVRIIGHGVTGSGRQIVGLHGISDCVVNEIIAHAEAALHFDREVDTIFEIGGQDAKYTHITDGLPADYAMNEACSAGTGSFLEEAAKESLNIQTVDIAEHALRGDAPVNFNDQCAAFIGSDIKSAIQEGVPSNDICAGLVYSICMNYSNRVKGSRPVGEKIFMQGGVCYNRAVPAAMASLTGKDIIVPPHPGLMGAFGVALIAARRIREGMLDEQDVSLESLINRGIVYKKSFVCRGDAQGCDRKCRIAVVEIEGRKFPFGGICNRFDNLVKHSNLDLTKLDYVSYRENLLHGDFFGIVADGKACTGRVGINRSLNNIAMMPLFSNFFAALDMQVVLPETIEPDGIQRQSAAFCYPVEISHGYMHDLLRMEPDVIFLPHIKGLHVPGGLDRGLACVLSQGEPYYLKAAFPELGSRRVLSPVLDFSAGLDNAEAQFVSIGIELGHSETAAKAAFAAAVQKQRDFGSTIRDKGREVLAALERDPDARAIVIFGRAYNAFSSFANMGIPRKLATRGETVLTLDMLPLEQNTPPSTMYWAAGQSIMQGAELVGRHPQLFGVYVTNFSCGPDSFLTAFFRREMNGKPSLILELDSHSADAGLDTRVDAFLDIIGGHAKLRGSAMADKEDTDDAGWQPAEVCQKPGGIALKNSAGKSFALSDDNVHILVPSMGRLATRSFVSSLRYCGVNATAAPDPGETELRRAKSYSTCKECLPLQLTLGSLLRYLDDREHADELLVYFMPESDGPCRFGQYNVLMRNVIRDLQIPDVAVLSLTSANSYAGLDSRFARKAWQGIVTADTLESIRNALTALATSPEQAMDIFQQEEDAIFQTMETASWRQVRESLAKAARRFAGIPLNNDYASAPKVLLAGEIYVRSDAFSRRNLVEKLAERGIVTTISPAYEWLYYTDYCLQNSLDGHRFSFRHRTMNRLEGVYKRHVEKQVKNILSASGLCSAHLVDVPRYIEASRNSISPQLTGEAGLTVGSAFAEIIHEVAGVISVGPFGCMPGRLSESIISKRISEEPKNIASSNGREAAVLERFPVLPYLALELDGNAFPQVTEARLEAFCLQVERLGNYLANARA